MSMQVCFQIMINFNKQCIEDLEFIFERVYPTWAHKGCSVLITGANGFIGYYMSRFFIRYFSELSLEKLTLVDLNIDELPKKNQICILIGPEGDFSEEERQLIINYKNVISITLAKNILRAETAAIASTTILNYNLENN